MSMTDYRAEHVGWTVDRGVGTITLRRPGSKNALTFASYEELVAIFDAIAHDAAITCVILTGSDGDFCSGGDVREIIGPLVGMDPAGRLRFTRMTGMLVKKMIACPKPIVAAVDGACAGAGAILAMASDIRLGTPRARVAFLFTRVGLAGCDMGACALLPRIVGFGRAAELLLTGRTMEAAEACDAGFFHVLHPPEALADASRALAARLGHGPLLALAVTKQMLYASFASSLDAAIDAEALAQAELMATNDFRRAYEAFDRKQTPAFEGD